VERSRRRHGVELAAGELDSDHVLGLPVASELIKIGPYRRSDRADEIANNPIFVEAVDRLQRGFDVREDFPLAIRARLSGQVQARIEARIKELDKSAGDRRMLAQRRP